MKIGRLVFEICERRDKHTNEETRHRGNVCHLRLHLVIDENWNINCWNINCCCFTLHM